MNTTTNNHTNQPTSLEDTLQAFLRSLSGKNRSTATITAYRTDLTQFIRWLTETTVVIHSPAQVQKVDITEYLATLSQQGLSGVSRARKLAAIREYFRFLEEHGLVDKSPVTGIETPKSEKNGRNYLRPDEYTKLLSLAGGNPRDYAIFQVFLQTGIRVSELCALELDDVDFVARTVSIREGKGQVARTIELEKKAIQALKSYIATRPLYASEQLFLNHRGEPISERGIRHLVSTYCQKAGITKQISPHSFRHTFGTMKAERGVSPFQLQQWLGHANLNTTQIYVHMGRQNARKQMEQTSL